MDDNRLRTADELLKNPTYLSGHYLSAFNDRLYGESYGDTVGYPHPPRAAGDRANGWNKADEMIGKGLVYYRHIFSHGCKTLSFSYGGTHVCNTCGRSNLDKPWWNIRVQMDGDQYCVTGEGFIDLMESDNFAFGKTKKEALENYENKMNKD